MQLINEIKASHLEVGDRLVNFGTITSVDPLINTDLIRISLSDYSSLLYGIVWFRAYQTVYIFSPFKPISVK